MPANILALLTDSYGGYGGIAQQSRDLIEAMCAQPGVENVVGLPRVADHALQPMPDKLDFDLSATGGLRHYVAALLRRLARGERFDLVYCAHINLSPLGRIASLLTRAPLVTCLHGLEAWTPPPRRSVRWGARTSDYVMPVSRLTLDRFRSWCDIDDAHAFVMPNAIRLEDFVAAPRDPALAERLHLTDRKVVMTLGRLDPMEQAKGFDRIIAVLPEVAKAEPSVAYMIVGSGGDRPRLQAMAQDLGVADRVVFAGGIDENEKVAHYNLADAYVMPSVAEGFGIVFLEALACGLPCVGSNFDGGREALREGKYGQLIDPHDPVALRDAMIQALRTPRAVPADLDHFGIPAYRARVGAMLEAIGNSRLS